MAVHLRSVGKRGSRVGKGRHARPPRFSRGVTGEFVAPPRAAAWDAMGLGARPRSPSPPGGGCPRGRVSDRGGPWRGVLSFLPPWRGVSVTHPAPVGATPRRASRRRGRARGSTQVPPAPTANAHSAPCRPAPPIPLPPPLPAPWRGTPGGSRWASWGRCSLGEKAFSSDPRGCLGVPDPPAAAPPVRVGGRQVRPPSSCGHGPPAVGGPSAKMLCLPRPAPPPTESGEGSAGPGRRPSRGRRVRRRRGALCAALPSRAPRRPAPTPAPVPGRSRWVAARALGWGAAPPGWGGCAPGTWFPESGRDRLAGRTRGGPRGEGRAGWGPRRRGRASRRLEVGWPRPAGVPGVAGPPAWFSWWPVRARGARLLRSRPRPSAAGPLPRLARGPPSPVAADPSPRLRASGRERPSAVRGCRPRPLPRGRRRPRVEGSRSPRARRRGGTPRAGGSVCGRRAAASAFSPGIGRGRRAGGGAGPGPARCTAFSGCRGTALGLGGLRR